MEQAVTFNNKNGQRLFGIVHIPEETARKDKKVGINLLNPGIKYRVAPHRLNVKLARELCKRGYYVFRFDPEGVGDSEGALPEGMLIPDIWGEIQTGLFMPDTIAANDYFIDNYMIEELMLIGNCGGAINALLTSERDTRVDALILIDVPVNLRTSKMSFADLVVEGGERANWLFLEYVKRLMRIQSWYRFFTMKTDYKALWRTIAIKFQKTFLSSNNDNKLPENLEILCNENKLNRLFFEAFEAVLRENKPILFALAENDPGSEVFQHYFQHSYLPGKFPSETYSELVEIFFVKHANHIYTFIESQQSLINKVSSWIEMQSHLKDNIKL